jgi:hypothetical protein
LIQKQQIYLSKKLGKTWAKIFVKDYRNLLYFKNNMNK